MQNTQQVPEGYTGPQISIGQHYIRDMSLEVPEGWKAFSHSNEKMGVEVNLDIKAAEPEASKFEVTLKINIKAKRDDLVMFLLELDFVGQFNITNLINEEQKEQILLIYCPTILFPFARRIVSDLTRDGGFTPILLDPIDFAALYVQQRSAAAAPNKIN